MKINRKLMLGDCLERMKEIPDNSIDMVLCDPPYGTTVCKWDSVIPFEPMWDELKRIVKDNGAICLFGSEPFSSHLRLSNLKMFKYDWIWYKSRNSNPVIAKHQPLRHHEIISVFNSNNTYYPVMTEGKEYKTRKTAGGSVAGNNTFKKDQEVKKVKLRYPKSIQEFKSVYPNGTLHPTQKPVALLEYLIKTYTLEKEIVLDFTMGSGSTGVAAKNLKRKFIGIEKEKKYFKIAKNRIKEIDNCILNIKKIRLIKR